MRNGPVKNGPKWVKKNKKQSNSGKRYIMDKNQLKLPKTFNNIPKWIENSRKPSKIIENGQKLSKAVQNRLITAKAVKNRKV